MIAAVVFDWGGVLGGQPAGSFASAEARLGLAPGTFPGLLGLHPYETDHENLWHRRELGLTSAREWAEWFVARVAAAGGPQLDVTEMVEMVQRQVSGLALNPIMLDTARDLQSRGYRLALCTNNFLETAELCRTALPSGLFDHVIVSSEVRLRKPDSAMYRHVNELLAVEPEATVLLDDFPANIAGARAAGWHGLLVGPDLLAARAELESLLAAHAA